VDEKRIQNILRIRKRARTDLQFLCNEILDYPDVSKEVHFPVLQIVQQFGKYQGQDYLSPGGRIQYIPLDNEPSRVIPYTEPRRRLILDPRAFLKTTINVISHSIQWILNYPDIAILVFHASEEKAIAMLREIKEHFLSNQTFRYYFPDYCPQTKSAMKRFGTTEWMTVPNRRRRTRKEPTISVGSIDKKMASSHFHVIKFSDIVDETNVTTEEQIKKVRLKYGFGRSLLIDPHHWIDVEGTIYDGDDLHVALMEMEMALPEEDRQFKIHYRPIYKKNVKGGQKFTPEERDMPYVLDANGKRISWWPETRDGRPKFDLKTLERMQNDPVVGEEQFACQYLLNPWETSMARPFPLDKMIWVPEKDIKRIPAEFYITSIDTAETTTGRSDDTAITTCKWDRIGRQYVVDIVFGKMLPHEIIDEIFRAFEKYQSRWVYIEETAFVRGLKSSVFRKEAELNVQLPLVFLKRDTNTSKRERILNQLQPAYRAGHLRFSEGLPDHVKERLKAEFSKFPKSSRDDLLDTLADQYQERDDFGAVRERNSVEQIMKRYQEQAMGIQLWSDWASGGVHEPREDEMWV